MGQYADDALNYFLRRMDFAVRPKHDRRRHKVMRCPTCGKGPLRFFEDPTDVWHLGEFDDDNKITKHVCKMKSVFKNVRT